MASAPATRCSMRRAGSRARGHAQRHGAVVVAPGRRGRRVAQRPQAPIAVGVRREQQHRLGHRRLQSADRVVQRRLVAREAVVAVLVAQADVDMQPVRGALGEGLGHEGRLQPLGARGRLDRALEQERVVGRLQRIGDVAEIDLELRPARTPRPRSWRAGPGSRSSARGATGSPRARRADRARRPRRARSRQASSAAARRAAARPPRAARRAGRTRARAPRPASGRARRSAPRRAAAPRAAPRRTAARRARRARPAPGRRRRARAPARSSRDRSGRAGRHRPPPTPAPRHRRWRRSHRCHRARTGKLSSPASAPLNASAVSRLPRAMPARSGRIRSTVVVLGKRCEEPRPPGALRILGGVAARQGWPAAAGVA